MDNDNDPDAGALADYGDAVGRLINMAMRSLQASDPTQYMMLMNGIKAGDTRLRLVTDVPVNQPGKMVLSAIDAAGTERAIATLALNSGTSN